MSKTIFSTTLIFFLLVSLPVQACKVSKEVGATLPTVVKSANLVFLGKVASLLEIIESNKDSVQIARLETVKVYKGENPQSLNVLTYLFKGQGDSQGMYKCRLSQKLSTGELYLVAPQFSVPNGLKKVKDQSEADALYSQAISQSKKALTIYETSLASKEAAIKKLAEQLKFCEKGDCSKHGIEGLFLSPELNYLTTRNDHSVSELILRLILSEKAVDAIDAAGFGRELLYLVLGHKDDLEIVLSDKPEVRKQINFRLKNLAIGEAIKIRQNGKDLTDAVFAKR